MLEFLTGTGLAVAAGLNAYIPMILIGLASRFLDFFQLPETWRWLENPWVLIILGVLLVIEIVADKIPVVDTVNDWIQTIVRPGGTARPAPRPDRRCRGSRRWARGSRGCS